MSIQLPANGPENPATQFTQRWTGRDLFFPEVGSLKTRLERPRSSPSRASSKDSCCESEVMLEITALPRQKLSRLCSETISRRPSSLRHAPQSLRYASSIFYPTHVRLSSRSCPRSQDPTACSNPSIISIIMDCDVLLQSPKGMTPSFSNNRELPLLDEKGQNCSPLRGAKEYCRKMWWRQLDGAECGRGS